MFKLQLTEANQCRYFFLNINGPALHIAESTMEFHVGSRYGSSALDVESGSVLEIHSSESLLYYLQHHVRVY